MSNNEKIEMIETFYKEHKEEIEDAPNCSILGAYRILDCVYTSNKMGAGVEEPILDAMICLINVAGIK